MTWKLINIEKYNIYFRKSTCPFCTGFDSTFYDVQLVNKLK